MRSSTVAIQLVLASGIGILSFLPLPALAQVSKARANVNSQSWVHAPTAPPQLDELVVTPLSPQENVSVLLMHPKKFKEGSRELEHVILDTHKALTKSFGQIPAFSISVRVLSQENFFALTGAPKWTNALYFRRQILLPLAASNPKETQELQRSLRHEYSHAIINSLSRGRTPGWIDEGLAQFLEGEEQPGLKPALFDWLSVHKPVELRLLQGGFTKLAPEMVPAAYAQSLFAVRTLISSYGFEAISKYFSLLRDDIGKAEAFRISFGITEADFETNFDETLADWKKASELAFDMAFQDT